MNTLGDTIFQHLSAYQEALFELGRTTQLSYNAYNGQIQFFKNSQDTQFTINYPLGMHADGGVMPGDWKFSKEEIIRQYEHLSNHQLSLSGVYQLVTFTEICLGILINEVVKAFPKKLSTKRSMPVACLFEHDNIEEARGAAISALRNELAYLSPRDFAESVTPILSINLLEIPAFHHYMELTATRDVFIHDRGIANPVYKSKAGSHSRVKPGLLLPMNMSYFLKSYEACLSLAEELMREFHAVWPSSLYASQLKKNEANQSVELTAPPAAGL
jgi:hypothetical protein